MRCYSIDGQQAVASPTDTVLGLTSAATIRPEVYHIIFGIEATPADNALVWLLQRYTAAGTGDAVTPQAFDKADPAALSSALENHTVEPTYTAGEVLLYLPLNQRATFPWYADKACHKLPATAANGVGVQPVHSSFTGVVSANIHFSE